MVVGGFERHEMEERCVRLVALANVGGGLVFVKLGGGLVVVMD